MTHNRCLEREREKKKQCRGNDSCHFSDQYFLPCFLCKCPAILFQNKKGIFQHKLHYCLGKLSRDRLSGENCQRVSAEALFLQYFLFSSKLKATLKKCLFDQH